MGGGGSPAGPHPHPEASRDAALGARVCGGDDLLRRQPAQLLVARGAVVEFEARQVEAWRVDLGGVGR